MEVREARKFYRNKGFERSGRTEFGGGEDSLLAREHETLILEKDLDKET